MKILLRSAGYSVDVEKDNSFMQRIQLSKKTDVDLFLLDRNVNGMDFLEICKSLKSKYYTKNIPVIMLSADYRIESLYKEAGAEAFVAKPFSSEALLSKIESLI